MRFKFTLFLFSLLFIGVSNLDAQDLKFPKLDPSPMDAAHYPDAAAYKNYLDADDPDRDLKVKVLYCRPNKKGREVFGKLVPYGKEWRLGANEATEVTFYRDVEIGGTYVRRGTYTMFADINQSNWTIKISTERFIGGNTNRDKSKDVVAVTIPVTKAKKEREEFTIGFQKIDEGMANMIFEWENTRATMPINFNVALLDGKDKSPMDLVQYPNSSRLRNFQKPEDLDKAVAKVRVVYSRPQMKGRKVFGELLKYGEMWRVGANETTEITFFQDVTINGKKVVKGKYGLFAKVNEGNWEFVIHRNIPSWGNARHDESTNVVTMTAKTEKTPTTVEALSILLKENGTDKIDLIVAWENTMARLPITLK